MKQVNAPSGDGADDRGQGSAFCMCFLLLWPSPEWTRYYSQSSFNSHLYPPSLHYGQFFYWFSSLPVMSRSLFPLQGLKKNWEEVHKEFQSLSVFIDSVPKKIRKQKLEKEMKQLEHDISVIEKHKIIYIANKWANCCRTEKSHMAITLNPLFSKRTMKRIKFSPKM